MRDCPSDGFDWGDLIVIVKHAGVESNLYRSMHPDEAGWTLTNMLLATIADVLRWLQWSKTKDGRKNRNMPEPIERPGVVPRKRRVHPKVKGAPVSKMRELLNQGREPVADKGSRLRRLFQTGKG